MAIGLLNAGDGGHRGPIGGIGALLLVMAFATSGSAQSLRFLRRDIAIPGSELKMHLMAGAEPVALAPPTVYRYRIDFPDGSQRIEERYDILELWRLEQRIGVWSDARGNRLELARLIHGAPPPPGPPGHGMRDAFDRWWVTARQPGYDPLPDQIRQWVVDYTAQPDPRMRTVPRPPMALRDVVLAEWHDRPQQLVCLFRLNAAAAGQSRADNTWFLAHLTAHPATDPQVLHREVADRFLPSIGLAVGARGPEPPATPAPLTRSDPLPATADRLAGRRQVLDSIRHLPDWWHAETAHYIILANVSTRTRTLINRLETDLETVRRAYATLIPAPRPITEVSVIRIFADAPDYARYVGENYAWTAGTWTPARREMVIRHPPGGAGRDQFDRLLRTVRHEAFHQYLFYAFEYAQSCPWFNEGHAVFFEQVQPSGSRVRIEPDPAIENTMLRLAAERRIDLPRLLRMDYPEFYDPDETRRRDNYALAWGLIHYLRLGDPRDNETASTLCERYAAALWNGRNGPNATQQAWQTIDMAAFDDDFSRFWAASQRRSSARRRPLFEGSR